MLVVKSEEAEKTLKSKFDTVMRKFFKLKEEFEPQDV